MDLSDTIKPKSNQLNADDLLAEPRTIRITKVGPGPNDEQPVAISYDGDNGRPYLPCKSMRRVLVAAWGKDATKYLGRQLTLFRDSSVAFGGVQTGGIRISHMTDLPAPELRIVLTMNRRQRAPHVVIRLAGESPPVPAAAPTDPAQRRVTPSTSAPAAPMRRPINDSTPTP
jgi:hypothetical protein